MRALLFALGALAGPAALGAGPYAPAPPPDGDPANASTAVPADDSRIIGWATGVAKLTRGPVDISDLSAGYATFGTASDALGPADATTTTTTPVVSLGDGGSITLTFSRPIANGAGADFAVYENGLNDSFLELAFVEVSTDGSHFVRFPAVSLTQTTTQVNGNDSAGTFGGLDPTNLNNLAGKYRAGYGTPFDLSDLANLPGSSYLDFNNIEYVRVVDVVGSIDPAYGTRDSLGNLINDPWTTPYASGGFDLDAVAILHTVPEPGASALGLGGALLLAARRRR